MSFARGFLDESGPLLDTAVREQVLEQELARRQVPTYLDGGAIVIHGARHSGPDAAALAFHLARDYAARRVHGAGALRRLARATATPLLPFVLAARILATMGRRWPTGRLARALPWLAILLFAWSSGECAGYLAGPGASRSRWR